MLKRVTTSGLELVVDDEGQGEPIVLVHGYPQNRQCWNGVAERLIAAGFRVIRPDWLGWGESPKAVDVSYTYDAEVARLGAFIEALDVGPANLVGHDYGGLLAAGLEEKRPELIARLGIINARGHRSFAPLPYLKLWLTCAAARVAGLFERLPLHWLHLRELKDAVSRGMSVEQLEGYVGWMRERDGKRWLARFYRDFTIAAHPEVGRERVVTKPVSLIWGDQDRYFPFTTALDLHRRWSGSRLTRVFGAGHYVLDECPQAVADALLELLSQPRVGSLGGSKTDSEKPVGPIAASGRPLAPPSEGM